MLATTTTGKKRGRPAKTAEDDAPEPPKKRGRPTKDAPAVPLNEDNAPPKKRGRPPKGGETTKIEADDDAAAEQLEEELVDEAEGAKDGPSKQAPSPKKRGRPAKGKGKGKAVAAAVVEEDDEVNDDAQAEAAGVSGTNYWLMKAEQEGREEILENGETVSISIVLLTMIVLQANNCSTTPPSPSTCCATRQARSRGMACATRRHART